MKKILLLAALVVPFVPFGAFAAEEDVTVPADVTVQTTVESTEANTPMQGDSIRKLRPVQNNLFAQYARKSKRMGTGRYEPYRYSNEDLHLQIGENKIESVKKRDPEFYEENCVYGIAYDYRIHYKTRLRSGFQRSNGYCRNYQETDVFSKRKLISYVRNARETRIKGTDPSIMKMQRRYDLELNGKAKLMRLWGVQY